MTKEKEKETKNVVVFQTNNMADALGSIRLGKWSRRKGGLTAKKYIPGSLVVFRHTVKGGGKGEYYISGIATKRSDDLTYNEKEINANWPSLDNTEGEFQFHPLTPVPVRATEFNVEFRGTKKANGRNHAFKLNDEQYQKLLSKVTEYSLKPGTNVINANWPNLVA